jgi:hypothetical protein
MGKIERTPGELGVLAVLCSLGRDKSSLITPALHIVPIRFLWFVKKSSTEPV